MRNIRKIIEKHPLTASLRPSKPDQWAADRFTIHRHKEMRDPSVMAAGITTNITGARADIIIYDDVEVPNTSKTAYKREDLRLKLQESNFVLVPGGTQLYVGTPHTYFSIYAQQPRAEINENNTFLEGFKRMKIPLLNKKNKCAWPEKFKQDDIDLLRKQTGVSKFTSQMMLEPVNVMEGRLDCNLLGFYDADIKYTEVMGQTYLSIMENKIVSCQAWWDPAFGSHNGDASVLAIVFTDEDGNHYLHDIQYIKVHVENENQDEASLQCEIVAKTLNEYYVPSIAIETNGIGKFLPSILKRELAQKNISCAVLEKTSTKTKSLRILEAFDVVMASRALSVHESVKQTPFLTEMMEWQPHHKNAKDDGLDAVSGALTLEPVRIKRCYATAKRKWFGTSQQQKAKTEFEV